MWYIVCALIVFSLPLFVKVKQLREGVKLFPPPNQWQRISDYLDSKRTKEQCFEKWRYLIRTDTHVEWSEKEVSIARVFCLPEFLI